MNQEEQPFMIHQAPPHGEVDMRAEMPHIHVNSRIPNCVEITRECYAELKEQGYVDFFPGERIVRLTYVPDGRMFWNSWGKMIVVGKCDNYPIQAIARLNDVSAVECPSRRAEAAESFS
ncbi:hypothetical protein ICN84_07770 [Akkermansia glycaniphila]|uniref:hypothetical protein n=1 Tax=Akkermansia glycaniphila TaxID=1679444 RepID=UPI001C02A570|nr:hypothetical protein [Akkermansia glycaniphila]MBT9449970.1 hypothetical protein [Akkermansia glycaniphila]